jgi:hypothetical protein
MKKLTFAITDAQREQNGALFRQRGNRVGGDVYLNRMINLHRATEHAAGLRGDPLEVDEAEMELVIRAARSMLALDRKTDYAGIQEEMDWIRRTDPPAGIPRKEHWVRALLRFGKDE